jgi:hypothetical protein
MFDEDPFIPISALQQWLYCPRQAREQGQVFPATIKISPSQEGRGLPSASSWWHGYERFAAVAAKP